MRYGWALPYLPSPVFYTQCSTLHLPLFKNVAVFAVCFFHELIQWHTNSSGGKFPVEEILTTSHTMTEICKTFHLCVCAVCCVRVIIIVGMSMRAYFWCIRLRRNWRANAIGACMLLAVLLILHNLNWLTIKCCTQKMRTSVSLLNDLWVFV